MFQFGSINNVTDSKKRRFIM